MWAWQSRPKSNGRASGMPAPQRDWTSEAGLKQHWALSVRYCRDSPSQHRDGAPSECIVHIYSTSCLGGRWELPDTQLCLALYLEPSKCSVCIHSLNEWISEMSMNELVGCIATVTLFRLQLKTHLVIDCDQLGGPRLS